MNPFVVEVEVGGDEQVYTVAHKDADGSLRSVWDQQTSFVMGEKLTCRKIFSAGLEPGRGFIALATYSAACAAADRLRTRHPGEVFKIIACSVPEGGAIWYGRWRFAAFECLLPERVIERCE